MVPKKNLNSIDFIKTNEEWEGCLDNIGQELIEMRVDYDSMVKLKPLETSNNRLLQRRMKLKEENENLYSVQIQSFIPESSKIQSLHHNMIRLIY